MTEKIPPLYQGTFKKAAEGKSKAAAIKAKCLECCCFQRIEVQNCTATSCPLWIYRPYQSESDAKTPPRRGT